MIFRESHFAKNMQTRPKFAKFIKELGKYQRNFQILGMKSFKWILYKMELVNRVSALQNYQILSNVMAENPNAWK